MVSVIIIYSNAMVFMVSWHCVLFLHGTCNGICFCCVISTSSQSHICLSFWLILVLEDLADTLKRKSTVQKKFTG
jgi:hypothetical protein